VCDFQSFLVPSDEQSDVAAAAVTAALPLPQALTVIAWQFHAAASAPLFHYKRSVHPTISDVYSSAVSGVYSIWQREANPPVLPLRKHYLAAYGERHVLKIEH